MHEKLYLGVSREIITPKIGCQLYGYAANVFSDSVADDLTATAFYFCQGNTRTLMLSLAVCTVETTLSDTIRAQIATQFDIPKNNIMLCCIHNHSGPNTSGTPGWGDMDHEYCNEIFIPQILLAVKKATQNLQAVKMGVAVGNSFVGVNRRELCFDNHIDFGQNPWGYFDKRMTVIAFQNEEENVIATMIHYGAHCTAAGRNTQISRDWPGVMIDTLENQSGAVTAFFNGPEGDVGPRLSNGKTTGNMDFVAELGAIAAQDAVNIYHDILEYHDVTLTVSQKELALPLKKRLPLETAQNLLQAYGNSAANTHVFQKTHLENVVDSYHTDYRDLDFDVVSQTIIGLGDVVFAAFPFELFSQVGLRISEQFPHLTVLSLSNTNGHEGYFVTEDAICRGGYEVDMFLNAHVQPFVDNADWYLMQETVKHIESIKKPL